jgi:hypothetical protein
MLKELTPDDVVSLLRDLPRVGSEHALSDALYDRDWHRVLSLAPKSHEEARRLAAEGIELHNVLEEGQSVSGARWLAFSMIADFLNDTEYWVLLGRCWVECEKAVDHPTGLKLFFPQDRDNSIRYLMMDDVERRRFNDLPATFTVFRGGRLGGWSWTLKTHLAGEFKDTEAAIEMADEDGKLEVSDDPEDQVATHGRHCNKNDVVAVFLRKGECEVVVDWNKLDEFES